MTGTARGGADGREEHTALAEVERLADLIVHDGLPTLTLYGNQIEKLRRAMCQARRDNVWDLVDLAFGQVVSTSLEMLLRATRQLNVHLLDSDHRRSPGGTDFPPLYESAERVERVARLLLDLSAQYGKVRHVSDIVRRSKPDPKIVEFEAERTKAKGRAAQSRKVGSRRRATAGSRA